MQFSIAAVLLATTTMANTPSQVKEELDARPWRPDPSLVVIGSQNAGPATSLAPVAPPQATTTPATATPVGDLWQLQIAALSSFEAAKTEQKRLQQLIGTTRIEIFTEGSIHRVRLGTYPSKEAAESAREELRSRGIDGFPVRRP